MRCNFDKSKQKSAGSAGFSSRRKNCIDEPAISYHPWRVNESTGERDSTIRSARFGEYRRLKVTHSAGTRLTLMCTQDRRQADQRVILSPSRKVRKLSTARFEVVSGWSEFAIHWAALLLAALMKRAQAPDQCRRSSLPASAHRDFAQRPRYSHWHLASVKGRRERLAHHGT